MTRTGFFVVALFAVALLLTPGVVAADEAQFVERDGVLYVFNVPGAGSWAGWAGSANTDYGRLIDEMAERYQVPAKLIAAVIKAESNFNPRAISRKGARGLMQLMPATAAQLGVRNVFDARDNVDGGVRHLRYLIGQYSGDVRLALAAYNAGAVAVDRVRGVPPYPETQSYVARVLAQFETPQRAIVGRRSVRSQAGASPRQGPMVAWAGMRRPSRYVAADGTTVYTNVPVESLPLATRDRLAKVRGQALALVNRE
jgi:hypothetical protein